MVEGMSFLIERKELQQRPYRQELVQKLLECVDEVAASTVGAVRINIISESESTYSALDVARITAEPSKMGGIPCIRSLRIPVSTVVGLVANGLTIEEILEDYPDLEREDVRAALTFAAAAVGSSHLSTVDSQ